MESDESKTQFCGGRYSHDGELWSVQVTVNHHALSHHLAGQKTQQQQQAGGWVRCPTSLPPLAPCVLTISLSLPHSPLPGRDSCRVSDPAIWLTAAAAVVGTRGMVSCNTYLQIIRLILIFWSHAWWAGRRAPLSVRCIIFSPRINKCVFPSSTYCCAVNNKQSIHSSTTCS